MARKCTACGATNPDRTETCGSCGEPLAERKEPRTGVIWLGVLGMGIGFVFLLYTIYIVQFEPLSYDEAENATDMFHAALLIFSFSAIVTVALLLVRFELLLEGK